MGYIGAEPATSFETVRKDRFTSQTGTTVTLSHTVSSINDIVVWVNSVKQDYTNYSVSGTTLTLGGSLVSADIVEVAYIGRTFQTVAPDTNMVTNAMMADDSIDSAEIVDGSVDAAHMAANSVDSDAYVDGSIDLAHMSSESVDEDNLHISNAGSNGQFLSKQSGNAGGLTWATAGGGLVPINQFAGTSDTTTIICNNWISSTYRNYVVYFEATPATDGASLNMTLYDSSGNISSGNYYNVVFSGIDEDGNVSNIATNNQNAWQLSHGLRGSGESDPPTYQAVMHWQSPHVADHITHVNATSCVLSNQPKDKGYAGAWAFLNDNLLTGFYFTASSGDIASWNIKCYGVVNS